MKKTISALLILAACAQLNAQNKEIIKTGLNFGPLPAVAFDADKGFQVGAILQIYDYGDGHNYPNYNSKTYLEYSYFTKGSQLIQARYDNKELIPGVRWSSSLRINIDKAFDFYGFNGYQNFYDQDRISAGKDKQSSDFIFSPFYRYNRREVSFKSDFLGRINDNLQWEAGIFASYFKTGSIDRESINKGKAEGKEYPGYMTTLFDLYKETGIISKEEADGGFSSGVRLGMVYDSRDKEGAPTRGIWAEGHITAAPGFMSHIGFARYSLTWRHYLPLIQNDVLTFAYRLNYEGTFGKNAPYYVLPYMTVMGEKCDMEGMGGYNTVRGIMRSRVMGLDMATYNTELRWRFTRFTIGKQNIALGLSVFSDGTTATRGRDLSALELLDRTNAPGAIGRPQVYNRDKDSIHVAFGSGFRFIMNENFIVAFEYGTPLTHFLKNSPLYNQDGTGAFYINLGYLF